MNWKKINDIILSVCVLLVVAWVGKELIFTETKTSVYSVEAVSVDSDKYGYQIMKDERIVIMQPFVPGVSGKRYFSSPDDALRVGRLVCKRLEADEDYSVTPEDIKQLGVYSFTE